MRFGLLIVAVLAAMYVSGCGGKEPISALQDPYVVPRQVNLASEELRDLTRFGQPVMGREAGILKVSLPVRNASDYLLQIDWRVTFVDGKGLPTGETLGWFKKTLEPRLWDTITFNSPSGAAENFRLDVAYVHAEGR